MQNRTLLACLDSYFRKLNWKSTCCCLSFKPNRRRRIEFGQVRLLAAAKNTDVYLHSPGFERTCGFQNAWLGIRIAQCFNRGGLPKRTVFDPILIGRVRLVVLALKHRDGLGIHLQSLRPVTVFVSQISTQQVGFCKTGSKQLGCRQGTNKVLEQLLGFAKKLSRFLRLVALCHKTTDYVQCSSKPMLIIDTVRVGVVQSPSRFDQFRREFHRFA